MSVALTERRCGSIAYHAMRKKNFRIHHHHAIVGLALTATGRRRQFAGSRATSRTKELPNKDENGRQGPATGSASASGSFAVSQPSVPSRYQ